jgi:hypothetical protein
MRSRHWILVATVYGRRNALNAYAPITPILMQPPAHFRSTRCRNCLSRSCPFVLSWKRRRVTPRMIEFSKAPMSRRFQCAGRMVTLETCRPIASAHPRGRRLSNRRGSRPIDHEFSRSGPRQRRGRDGDSAEIQKPDDRVLRAQVQRLFDATIVGGCAGPPETSIVQRMCGDQNVLRGCARRNDLLDRRDVPVLAQARRNQPRRPRQRWRCVIEHDG